MTTDMNAEARAERAELADLLASLSDDQWQAPSLCSQWRVHDVAAHVIGYGELTPMRFAYCRARGWSLARINAADVARYLDASPEQLVELIRARQQPVGLTAWFGGRVALAEAMIHHQDIRRPLGLARTIPPPRLRAALDFVRFAPLIRGAWRVRGLRLVATDIDWAFGAGPEIRGTGEALLMAMAARPAALDDLTGPGHPRLARRI
ncbi:maleylpyruvate isomerase family mycothiol-dependent enzyme [Nocardia lijiangensis]|uniref:maleylpyruvate isomerase family mycothiol-dependent enzyme n=1 Tax=Nocardia lijiangensis TaxID=299618 RepID=UPI003D75D25E